MATVSGADPDEVLTGDDVPARPRVALVLGSGGARGYAHIGVVQVLQELGYDIAAVSGSSMGAVVGGMLATGKLGEFTDWAVGLGQFEVLRLMDVSLSAKGAIRGERIFKVVGDIVGEVEIQDLPIEYTAVAVDLLAHREVWFQRGPLELAIRASTAIPSFVQPVFHNGRVLVDGGLLDPVPVAPVTAARADLVVAVNLNGREPTTNRPESVSSAPSATPHDDGVAEEISEGLRGTAARWFDSDLLAAVRRRLPDDLERSVRSRLESDRTGRGDASANASGRGAGGRGDPARGDASRSDSPGSVEIMAMSLEAMQGALTRHRLAAYPPDITISVPKGAARTLDMHRASEMIELGRQLATEVIVPPTL